VANVRTDVLTEGFHGWFSQQTVILW